MATGTGIDVSKANAYTVVAPPSLVVSKAQMYIVLSPGGSPGATQQPAFIIGN